MFKLKIETGNAAFEEAPGAEIARILRELATGLEDWPGMKAKFLLIDINGNTVGEASM